ncbi:MAG: fumarylacetoacetate hydrolase family protein [Sphingomonadales bacterium]|nr:fumarylacetoacetate hydrolase family protein [Sphingomonadales bacterium]
MKLISFEDRGRREIGLVHDHKPYRLSVLQPALPHDMTEFLSLGEAAMQQAQDANRRITSGDCESEALITHDIQLLAPVPRPTSCRDGYAFRQHVAAARRNRGVDMIAEFDQYPIFYFTNHRSVQGPGAIRCMPDHFRQLDFELEVAVVIGKSGRNIRAAEADQYIAGYTIMNDMSARTLQMEEMLLNLGPAKGKDFSTVIGPWLVTPDELETYRCAPMAGHTGSAFRLDMVCRVNGVEVSRGNMGDMDWTFAEIIERCAYGVDLAPGDVIGSGTVGTGCFLELNGTGRRLNPEGFVAQWLQEGDRVDLEVTSLGLLSNYIEREGDDFSILALKKN